MAFGFNADEILQMAERIERNGVRFYRAAAEAADKTLAERFGALAEMEAAHEQTFAAMRADLSSEERQTTTFDPNNETRAYLAAMADSSVFDEKTDPTDLVARAASPAEVLRVAIGLEKESILFYLGLKGLVPNRLGRDRIERIIEEERQHVALLSRQLSALD